jgi:hypothetical protein
MPDTIHFVRFEPDFGCKSVITQSFTAPVKPADAGCEHLTRQSVFCKG